MVLKRIFVARHGFREQFDFADCKTTTPRDVPLTAVGVEQAQQLGQYFAQSDIKPDAIFVSPWYRCLQTAEPTATALDLPLHVEHGLAEFFRTATPGTGLQPRPGSIASIQTHFPCVASSHESLMYVSQQGETIEALHARSRAFASVFVDFIDRVHPEWETVLLVSHAGTAITLGRAFVGKPQANIRAYVASLSCYERESAGDGVWQCTLNGSCAHLKDGELWNFSLEEDEMTQEDGVPGLVASQPEGWSMLKI